MIEYVSRNIVHRDLNMNQYGMEHCWPGHYHGPAVRDHYLIHYIMDGEGRFEVGDRTYRLRKGQGFLIYPGTLTYYQADRISPWTYCWVGFQGLQAERLLRQGGLSPELPTFRFDQPEIIHQHLTEMIESKEWIKARDIRLVGLLYLMLSHIVENSPNAVERENRGNRDAWYVKNAVHFIEMNYSGKIKISEVADYIGLNRSYLSSLFRTRMDISIQDYLIRFRIAKACELMKNGELSIGDIARSVGYEDPLLFSRMFKKIKGTAPKQFRKQFELRPAHNEAQWIDYY